MATTPARGQETNLLSQTNAPRDMAELAQTNEITSAGDLVQTNDLTGSNDLGVAEEIAGQTNAPSRTNGISQVGRTANTSRDIRLRADSEPPEQNRARAADIPAAGTPERLAGEAPSPSRNTPAKPVFSSFRLITERNIFDPNRLPHRTPGPRPAPKTTESFALVGIMSYEKGTFAFFDGSSSVYKKALKVADTIAGYKVMDLTPESVKLAAGTNQVELRVGSELRREEGGAWVLAKGAGPYAASATMASSATPVAAAAGGTAANPAENDVLERLRKKREQE